MNRNVPLALSIAGLTMLSGTSFINAQDGGVETVPMHEITPPVQTQPVYLALCLDTSNSMDGLIDAAKQKLWAIVNDLALAEPTPDLRVALMSYGNDSYNPETGWVRMETDFTVDLDLVSEKLFGLTTNGGTEYVGRVLQSSLKQLNWSHSVDTLQLVVVAGNESADQDQEAKVTDICRDLINQGIMVNPIYCGPATDSITPSWRQVATLTDGHFASIDQDNGTVVIATPFDERLNELSQSINTTYIPYGEEGQVKLIAQTVQDNNASGMSSSASAGRAQSKGSALYRNAMWDLVDAMLEDDFDLAAVEEKDLPENMRAMTLEQRQAYIKEMADKRAAIKKQIAEAAKQRQAFISEEMKKHGQDDSNSFDAAIRRAIRAQAVSKGFRFKEETPESVDKPEEKPETSPEKPQSDGES